MKRYVAKGLIPIIILSFLLTGCKKNTELVKYEGQFLDLFDTVTTIVGYEKNQTEFKEKIGQLKKELEQYHKLYNIYDSYEGINNIKTINENAGKKPIKVDKRIIDLLILGKELYDKTDGKVNIAYGSVLSIWHDYRTIGIENPENAKLPTMEELKKAKEYTDITKLTIDKENSTVYLEEEKMALDVGSLGKGYAVEMLGKYAEKIGMSKVLISVGGNICSVGTRNDESQWRVGLQNPDMDSEQTYLMKIKLEDESFVTSGNYQRYYIVDGKQYNHIINPNTLMPAEYFASVSVLSPHSGVADGLSTALYNMSYEEGKAIVEQSENTEAIWIMKDGTIQYTDGMKDRIIK